MELGREELGFLRRELLFGEHALRRQVGELLSNLFPGNLRPTYSTGPVLMAW
jgi:hypothetical protein